MPSELTPAAELSALVHGLRRHAARRQRMGDRRTPRWEAPPAAPEPPQASAPVAEPAPAPLPEPAPEAGPVPEPAPASTSPADDWGDTPTLKDESDRRAAILTERAAAAQDLEALASEVAQCTACGLCQSRTQTVFMDGGGSAGVLFVGEAPGFHEDREGVPFVGQAGELLTDIIQKGMKLRREEVSIANVLKCRPPENRDPLPSEKRLCTIWLDRQIELLNPRVLIPLGRHASGHLLASDAPMGRLRGKVWERDGRKVVPTYHPAFLLRSPEFKRECWRDIQLAMAELGPGTPS